MYRSPKEQIAMMPELFLSLGHMEEAAALMSADRAIGGFRADYASPHEQLKRTPRKTYR